ncbi:MAG: hypothetical protein V4850_02115 [Myxococcota bacterium]
MRQFASLLGVMGLLLAAPAFAQTPGITGELEQSSTTSPKEKTQFTDAALAEIEDSVKTVEALLTAAEKEKNVEEIECLTRKLTPLRALLEVSRQSANTMRLSLASNDTVHADQEFRKVAVALTKAREFLAEAQACVGDTGVDRGDASSTVTDNGENTIDADSDIPEIEVPLDGPDSTPR